MSLIDFGQLSPQEMVLNYLIEIRGRGFFFPYSDMALIDMWIKLCPDFDELLVILGDTAPLYFQARSVGHPQGSRTLKGYHPIVLKRIRERLSIGISSRDNGPPNRN